MNTLKAKTMKTMQWPLRLLMLGLLLTGAGTLYAQEMDNTFASPEEAAAKAKADFLEILKSGQEFNFGVDPAALERSEPEMTFERATVSFERLLSAADSVALGELVGDRPGSVVTLEGNGQVVTVVEVSGSGSNWRIVGFSDQHLTESLNEISGVRMELGSSGLVLYTVPNIHASVFGVQTEQGEMYLTDYSGMTLDRPLQASDLVPLLRGDAAKFQEEFGDRLRDGRLVK